MAPGRALASAMSSLTDFTGKDGCTAITAGDVVVSEIGA